MKLIASFLLLFTLVSKAQAHPSCGSSLEQSAALVEVLEQMKKVAQDHALIEYFDWTQVFSTQEYSPYCLFTTEKSLLDEFQSIKTILEQENQLPPIWTEAQRDLQWLIPKGNYVRCEILREVGHSVEQKIYFIGISNNFFLMFHWGMEN